MTWTVYPFEDSTTKKKSAEKQNKSNSIGIQAIAIRWRTTHSPIYALLHYHICIINKSVCRMEYHFFYFLFFHDLFVPHVMYNILCADNGWHDSYVIHVYASRHHIQHKQFTIDTEYATYTCAKCAYTCTQRMRPTYNLPYSRKQREARHEGKPYAISLKIKSIFDSYVFSRELLLHSTCTPMTLVPSMKVRDNARPIHT